MVITLFHNGVPAVEPCGIVWLIPRYFEEKLNGNKPRLVSIMNSLFSEHLIQNQEFFLSFQLLKMKNISVSFPVRIWVNTA